MVFAAGQSGNISGKPAGTPNKTTLRAREAIAAFVDDNAVRLTEWLDAIAAENPKAAFDCFMSVVEYHIPKLSRAENINKSAKSAVTKLHCAHHAKKDAERMRANRRLKTTNDSSTIQECNQPASTSGLTNDSKS